LIPTGTSLAIETNSQEFHGLFTLYMIIATAIAVLVFGSIAYAVIRYRRRPGREPREVRGLKPLEAFWVTTVAAIVVVLIVLTFRTDDRIEAVSANPAQTIDVVAFQWGWRFTYPGSGITTVGEGDNPPTLVVPADETVQFNLTSRDVIHSFWIPEMRFKRDAFPMRTTTFDMVFDPGVTATARCAEFCGYGHDNMDFQVVSMDAPDFERWLQTHEEKGSKS
jgi:cytochrome c oxidase subunit 2